MAAHQPAVRCFLEYQRDWVCRDTHTFYVLVLIAFLKQRPQTYEVSAKMQKQE